MADSFVMYSLRWIVGKCLGPARRQRISDYSTYVHSISAMLLSGSSSKLTPCIYSAKIVYPSIDTDIPSRCRVARESHATRSVLEILINDRIGHGAYSIECLAGKLGFDDWFSLFT